MSDESTDLKDYMDRVENYEAWVSCPHCGSEDVTITNRSPYSDLRTVVDCDNCPAKGYFD